MEWILGALFPGIKRPRYEADHSPSSSAEVEMCGVTPAFTCGFHGAVIIKAQRKL
jgi:hypothetical protein